MREETAIAVPVAALLFTLIFSVSPARGYTNPIENQRTETIDNVVWDLDSTNLYLGSNTWGNAMIITNGGVVSNAYGFIGREVNGYSNVVTVTGAESKWINKWSIEVGNEGPNNSLLIENGGYVKNYGCDIGDNSDGNRVSVDGAGSKWVNSSTLNIGNHGAGNELSIQNGGYIESHDVGIAILWSGADSNRVTVSGSGSVWTNSSTFELGSYSRGNSLSISSGGQIYNGGNFYIGYDAGATGNRLTVEGVSSELGIGHRLSMGTYGYSNSLSIVDGGRVQCDYGSLGHLYAYDNTMLVDGSGSRWTCDSELAVGDYGNGNLLIVTNGGYVECGGSGYVGKTGGGNKALVTGSGSIWTNSGEMVVGFEGSGNQLSITAGGRAVSLESYVGYREGGTGNSIVVSGAGSVLSNENSLFVGGSSEGAGGINNSMTVSSSAFVSATAATIYPTNSLRLKSGGMLAVSNGLTNKLDSTLEMEISGTGASDYGHLTANETTVLEGTLQVELTGGYIPGLGDVFDLFDWNGGVSNSFDHVQFPLLPFGLGWDTNDLYTTGHLAIGFGTADSDGDGMADGWELQYFDGNVSTNGNPDFDPYNNIQEYIAGTDPTNAASYFHITNAWPSAAGFVVEWDPSVAGRWYTMVWTNDLTGAFTSVVSGIDFPQNSATDTTHNAASEGFYRMEVELK